MNSYFTKDDGTRLMYRVTGVGEPLCLIHGFSLNSAMWTEQVHFFSQYFQVITYDLRGFGHSSLPTTAYSHHQDLAELLAFLKISAAHIVGLSLGGEIALNFCLEYPHLVKKLVLADSSLSGYDSTVDWNVHIEDGGLEKAKLRWLKHPVFAYTAGHQQAKQKLQRMINEYSGWHWLHVDPATSPQPPAIHRLNEIERPTLILVGEHDLSYYHDISEVLVGHIQNSTKVIVPQAGHMINWDNAEAFNLQLESFIKP